MTTSALNNDFEVGDDLFTLQEDAFPPSLSVPQFLEQGSETLPAQNSPNRWPPQLIIDVALGVDDQETILMRYGLTEANLARLYEIPSFRREVGLMAREMRENGVSFCRKAATQAEEYLAPVHHLMYCPETPASTKLDIFKTMAKYGKLEPVPEKADNQNQNTINVQINL